MRGWVGGFGAVGELLGGESFVGGWLVVGGIVGEDCGAVEGAVVFGKVELEDFVQYLVRFLFFFDEGKEGEEGGGRILTYPALIADSFWPFTADTNTDDVGGGVEEVLAKLDQLLISHLLD